MMMKVPYLAATAHRISYRFFSRHYSRNYVTAWWEKKLYQSNNDAPPTKKTHTAGFIGTDGLFNEEVFVCTEGVCGNASQNEFFNSSSISVYSQEEELVIAEDEDEDCTISISDDDCASEYESLRITTAGDVMHVATKLLAKKGFSVAELRNMLSEKFPLDIVDNVIEAMKKRGYLNDGMYAESFSRSRFLHSLWGPELIQQALILKGIPDVVAEKAIKRVFRDNYDYHNNMLKITTTKNTDIYDYDVEEEMSQSAMDYLYLQASKQWTRERNIPLEHRKMSIIRWLRDRSFSSRVTGAILRKLWSERFQPDEY